MDILLNITNLCNAKCQMCNIWKNKKSANSFLKPDLVRSITGAKTITFAGGEPFMHEGIVDIAREAHAASPKARLIFSTNGFQTALIAKKAKEIQEFCPNMHVTISLDGLGKKHDEVRGTHGALEKVNKTHKALNDIGVKKVNFGFTLLEENTDQLEPVYRFAKSKKSELSFVVAQTKSYLSVGLKEMSIDHAYGPLNSIVEDRLKSWNIKEWVRAFHVYGWIAFLRSGERPLPCRAVKSFVMVNETGDVCSCNQLAIPIGSLKRNSFNDILASDQSREVREAIKDCRDCWGVQETRSAVRASPVRVVLWIVSNKALYHLNMRNGRGKSILFPHRA